MRESLLEIINTKSSAVIANVDVSFVDDITDFIKSYNYDYLILSSSSDKKNVRLGFINGINEYSGNDQFIKHRIFSELNLLNKTLKINIDEHYLTYMVEWIYYLHTVDNPLNYLDFDGLVFDYLLDFFDDKYHYEPSKEDEVAIKFLKVAKEFLDDDFTLPIVTLRDMLFTHPTILIVSEAFDLKSKYIVNLLKDYHDDTNEIEEYSHPLIFMKMQS